MRKNHTPLLLKVCLDWWRTQYIHRFIRPQFDSLGEGVGILEPRSVRIFGANIHAGKNLHVISSREKPVSLSCWSSKQHRGKIKIGDHVLISPGVSISSAQSIVIGDNCMIAADVYISDSDWHGLYNRTRPFRCSAGIELKENVWIGSRAIVNKGVCIGQNSVVAAGSVVVESVPDHCVVGGNPAKIIKRIDPKKRMIKRDFLFRDHEHYESNQKELTKYVLMNNSVWDYIRSSLFPNKTD